MTTRESIDGFLSQKRLAVVGVSRNEKDFTRLLFRAFVERGYEVIPVNPQADQLEGRPCYHHVQDIQPPVDGALLLTRPEITAEVVRDCARAGIKRVWMHRGEGIGAVNPEAVRFCQERGIDVVEGHCPFMFLSNTGFVHRAHGFFKKVGGTYPV